MTTSADRGGGIVATGAFEREALELPGGVVVEAELGPHAAKTNRSPTIIEARMCGKRSPIGASYVQAGAKH